MNGEEFKKASAEMSEYIVNYLNNIRERRVLSDVEPGYLRNLLPEHLPDEPEKFSDIMKDVEKFIMPGITHWNSPRFHAYYPTGSSYPSILADMLTGAIGCIGFTWIASPSCTELEVIMMDWLGELIGLPKEFLAKNGTNGGGVIQMSASDAVYVILLTAKKKKLREFGLTDTSDPIVSKFIVYSSEESHSAVLRAAVLGGVKYRSVPSDEKFSLRGTTLRKYMEEDIQKGLIPFLVVPTLGTTFSCSFDNIREIGEVCNELNVWCHVDAAYAGAAFICPEYQYLMDGIELMDSFNFNPHKWMLVNFDCSALWLKNSRDIVDTCKVDLILLRHKHEDIVPDYRHWQIPLGRRFRSLKLWFVFRIYGKSGLQNHIRKQVSLAKEFENFVKQDERFEIFGDVTLGLVCFRMKGSNEENKNLLDIINAGGSIYLVPAEVKGVYFLRFAVCSRFTESSDVLFSWKEIQKLATHLLNKK